LRIVFAGTPINAAKTLKALVAAGNTIVGVLTRADAPTGRSGTVTESPVAAVASSLGIPVLKSNTVDTDVLDWISGLTPDLGVIVAYGCILKSDALEIPSKGWINVHYSLLPKYAGASPVQHAILDGETETGVTVFKLDEGVDTGPVLSVQRTDIRPDENTGELLERLTEIGSALLCRTLGDFDNQYSSRSFQEIDSTRLATRKISRALARLDFNQSSKDVVNKVRAMNPEPVAWFEFESLPVRVLEATVEGSAELAAGVARLLGSQLIVGCSDGSVALELVQPAGKKPMSGADWFRGLRRDSLLLS
jgi:methionyl-tRNA formyltransferase